VVEGGESIVERCSTNEDARRQDFLIADERSLALLSILRSLRVPLTALFSSAHIGYVTPLTKLRGEEQQVFAQRDQKVEAARETRKAKRKAATQPAAIA